MGPVKSLVIATMFLIVLAAGGCESDPLLNITGNNNVVEFEQNQNNDITTGDNNTGDLDNVSGDCGTCDDEGDPWDGACYSVPSCTQVECSTCAIFGGWRDCQTAACTATE